MNFENKTASTNEEKCELFAEFIQRTYTDDHQWVPSYSGPTIFLMMFRWVQFSISEVEQVLLNLDANIGPEPDKIPPLILKKMCNSLLSASSHDL
jgi:hypothetical protein